MAYTYDPENIFAKILRSEVPNDTVLETDHTLVFRDIAPQMPIHVLVIPKGAYVCYDDFAANASDAEIVDFNRTAAKVCAMLNVSADANDGYRAISNSGLHGVQEVPHFHMHLLGGAQLGRMVQRA